MGGDAPPLLTANQKRWWRVGSPFPPARVCVWTLDVPSNETGSHKLCWSPCRRLYSYLLLVDGGDSNTHNADISVLNRIYLISRLNRPPVRAPVGKSLDFYLCVYVYGVCVCVCVRVEGVFECAQCSVHQWPSMF
ncbi:hypothetical protein AAFF_G00346040 [Aldrovandia affinis]|uniref:Uncharacterized protein n=1 Tax=Aldrovandia affinis TaxID=143900 RepID=A0AAD7WNN0_9TELE|nr:hypothetical protein AAFF_G00346040 [Aldrovandia affinis]